MIPTEYHVLADSLGKVIEISYHHSWQRTEVIGIWFGSRFVGDPLVGVAAEQERPTGIHLRYQQNHVSLSGVHADYVGRTATLRLYDLYGRLINNQTFVLQPTTELHVPHSITQTGSICAWMLEIEDGRVERGIVAIE